MLGDPASPVPRGTSLSQGKPPLKKRRLRRSGIGYPVERAEAVNVILIVPGSAGRLIHRLMRKVLVIVVVAQAVGPGYSGGPGIFSGRSRAAGDERLVDTVKKVERGEIKENPRHITELRLN